MPWTKMRSPVDRHRAVAGAEARAVQTTGGPDRAATPAAARSPSRCRCDRGPATAASRPAADRHDTRPAANDRREDVALDRHVLLERSSIPNTQHELPRTRRSNVRTSTLEPCALGSPSSWTSWKSARQSTRSERDAGRDAERPRPAALADEPGRREPGRTRTRPGCSACRTRCGPSASTNKQPAAHAAAEVGERVGVLPLQCSRRRT